MRPLAQQSPEQQSTLQATSGSRWVGTQEAEHVRVQPLA